MCHLPGWKGDCSQHEPGRRYNDAMGQRLGLIIFLLVVVWQIVSAIINQANANKQQKQAEDSARTRRESQASSDPEAAEAASPRSRVDKLAARRKAQLEELRKRRDKERQQARTSQSRSTQTRVGSQQQAPQQSRQGPTPQHGTAHAPRSRNNPWQPRKEAESRPHAAEAKSSTQEASTRETAEAKARVERQAARARLVYEPDASTEEAQSAFRSDIGKSLRSKRELRRLFVMKELLDRPLSLRSPE